MVGNDGSWSNSSPNYRTTIVCVLFIGKQEKRKTILQ